MTFSMGTTPAAAVPLGDRLEDRPEAPERGPLDVAERGEDGVLREGARFTGIGDDIGQVAESRRAGPVGPRRAAPSAPGSS